MSSRLVLFVHGWGVHNTNTYGEFPERLANEAKNQNDLALDVQHIWLSEYVTFNDDVRIEDLARAFDAALFKKLGSEIRKGRKIVCITHSTGAPVIRHWWDQFYLSGSRRRPCPISHLIMLAPANFGSALAQLGKKRISRLKTWFQGIEPGVKVLNWLELGSPEAWELNKKWIYASKVTTEKNAIFPFVLSGQTINRKLYDHVNSYTDEMGSDGVIRLSSAQLNACYVKLEQESFAKTEKRRGGLARLLLKEKVNSQLVAFALIEGCSHTNELGIVTSVKNDAKPHPALTAVLECIRVNSHGDYTKLATEFSERNKKIFENEKVEIVDRKLLPDLEFIHDRCSMIIFRVVDNEGAVIDDFDLLLTGDENDPDGLPSGFFVDRQKNSRHLGTVTYYVNYDLLMGASEVVDPKSKKVLRGETIGLKRFGIQLFPQPDSGIVHYLGCQLNATIPYLKGFIEPNQTTMIDIEVKRVIHSGIFNLTRERKENDFRDFNPGERI